MSRRDVNDLGVQEETAAADVDPGQQSAAGPTRRAAVVIHPAKHDDMDTFQAVVRKAMTELGWAEPLWLETRPDDTGERLAREAVRSGVDLVLASGGDGTITACVAGVAGSGIPLGVLPCGTGNLLARNLALPLSLDKALTVALTGSDRRLDVGTANGRPFVVMAGIGFDAELLEGTSEELKKHMGWAAYVLSALRHLGDRPVRVVLRADSGPPQRRWASGVIIGNVGSLQGNVRLLPDAVPPMTAFLTWQSLPPGAGPGGCGSPPTCCCGAGPAVWAGWPAVTCSSTSAVRGRGRWMGRSPDAHGS